MLFRLTLSGRLVAVWTVVAFNTVLCFTEEELAWDRALFSLPFARLGLPLAGLCGSEFVFLLARVPVLAVSLLEMVAVLACFGTAQSLT